MLKSFDLAAGSVPQLLAVAKGFGHQKPDALPEAANAGGLPVRIEEGSVSRERLERAHKESFDRIVVASATGEFPNFEIGPNLARLVRNAHCTVTVVRD